MYGEKSYVVLVKGDNGLESVTHPYRTREQAITRAETESRENMGVPYYIGLVFAKVITEIPVAPKTEVIPLNG